MATLSARHRVDQEFDDQGSLCFAKMRPFIKTGNIAPPLKNVLYFSKSSLHLAAETSVVGAQGPSLNPRLGKLSYFYGN